MIRTSVVYKGSKILRLQPYFGWDTNLRICSARKHWAFVAFIWGIQKCRAWKSNPRNLTVSTWGMGIFTMIGGRGRLRDLMNLVFGMEIRNPWGDSHEWTLLIVSFRMRWAHFGRLERKWMLRSSESRIVSIGEGIILLMSFIAIKKKVTLGG